MHDDRMPLAALRVRAGYTQTEAAEKLGVSKGTLAKWEQNSLQIPMLHIEKIVHLYQVSQAGIYIGDASELSARIAEQYDQHVKTARKQVNVREA